MRWRATFAPDAGNATRARAGLGQALADAGLTSAVVGDALLIAGEMIGNAVRHARTDFTVLASLMGPTLRLEVFDRDTRPPSVVDLDDRSTGGRGLHLVSALATAWGWHTAKDDQGVSGKIVWAELRTDRALGR